MPPYYGQSYLPVPYSPASGTYGLTDVAFFASGDLPSPAIYGPAVTPSGAAQAFWPAQSPRLVAPVLGTSSASASSSSGSGSGSSGSGQGGLASLIPGPPPPQQQQQQQQQQPQRSGAAVTTNSMDSSGPSAAETVPDASGSPGKRSPPDPDDSAVDSKRLRA